jgi:hypothetical protein
MNKWITRIIVAILVIGALAGFGITAYRLGHQQGAQGTGEDISLFFNRPDGFERDRTPQIIPGRNDRGFNRGPGHGFGTNRFMMMDRGRGLGFFSPFQLLFRIALLGLVIWFGYRLFKGNGWQLSLTRQPENPGPSEATTNTQKKEDVA